MIRILLSTPCRAESPRRGPPAPFGKSRYSPAWAALTGRRGGSRCRSFSQRKRIRRHSWVLRDSFPHLLLASFSRLPWLGIAPPLPMKNIPNTSYQDYSIVCGKFLFDFVNSIFTAEEPGADLDFS